MPAQGTVSIPKRRSIDGVVYPGWLTGAATICAVIVILLVYSGACYFQSGEDGLPGRNPLKPSYIYYFVYALSIVVFGVTLSQGRFPKIPALGAFLILMFMVTLLWGTGVGASSMQEHIFALRVNYFLFTLAFINVLLAVKNLRWLIDSVRVVMVFILLFNVSAIFIPHLFPFKMTPDAGRAGGLIFEPNNCALLIGSVIPFACLGAKLPVRLALYLVGLAAIVATFSREGIIYWLFGTALAEFLPPGREFRINHFQLAMLAGLALLMLLLSPILLDSADNVVQVLKPFLNQDTLARIGGQVSGDKASVERIYVVEYAYREFLKAPLLGHGVGYASVWALHVSTHNMVLLLMVEYGMVGILLLILFIRSLYAMKRPYGVWAGTLFVITIPFVHYYFDLPCFGVPMVLCWLASRHDSALIRLGRPVRTKASDGRVPAAA